MLPRFAKLVRWLYPPFQDLEPLQQVYAVGDVLGVVFYSALLALALPWLVLSTQFSWDWESGLFLGLLLSLMLLFERLPFYFNFEISPGRFASFEGALDGMLLWTGFFLFGPVVIWFVLIQELINLVARQWKAESPGRRWALVRVFFLNASTGMISLLAANQVYLRLGGIFPIPSLRMSALLPALAEIFTSMVMFMLLFGLFLTYLTWTQRQVAPAVPGKPVAVFWLQASGILYLSHPFGILAAGIYVQNQQLISLLFFYVGMGLVALIARRLSQELETSRQQSRQVEQLEQLSRAIINGSPDASDLAEILAEHVPRMFSSARAYIWVEGRSFLLPPDEDDPLDAASLWDWVQSSSDTLVLSPGAPVPWKAGLPAEAPLILAPIFENRGSSNQALLGFVLVSFFPGRQSRSNHSLQRHLPVVQTLTDQVASALRQALVYQETLNSQRNSDELRLAGEIQASFFPDVLPELPGWQLAVTILPARETSGDFFDFILLEDGRLGILIADVTDKGVGPALYMALSRTLIRTYAIEYEADPDVVFFATNQRILQDARANLFVTVFYGILDSKTGEMVYSNAGHNPPYLLRKADGAIEKLEVTGMPIGLDEESVWQTARVKFNPGDALLLYTDGIPDSINEAGEFFDDAGMLGIAKQGLGTSALEMQAMIIDEVQEFCGSTPQVDDITLIVLTRDEE